MTLPDWIPVINPGILMVGFMSALIAFTVGLSGWVTISRQRRAAARTPDMIEAQREAKIISACKKEAAELAVQIPYHLSTQMKKDAVVDASLNIGKPKKAIKRIHFSESLITLTEIWFKLDGRPQKMPRGVSFYDLMGQENEDKVIFNLEHGIGRPCRWHKDNRYNIFMRVGLRNANMGVPKIVHWNEVYERLPKTRKRVVAIGVNQYSKLIYEDFTWWPHLIVAGSTRKGKSTWLIQAIVTLIKRNTPEELQFIFIDLKDGLELAQFENIPHARRFVTETEETPKLLEELHEEYKSRVAQYRQHNVKNIKGYNSLPKVKKHPYIILVVDEMADMMLNVKEIRDPNEYWSTKLARKARAAGIHLWYCTQIVQAAVMPLQVRGNFDGRLCFSMPDFVESRLVLSNGFAAGLNHPGLAIYKFHEQIRLQAPIATEAEVKDAIAAAGRKEVEVAPEMDATDLFNLALDNFHGNCAYKRLLQDSDGLMPERKMVKILKEHEYDPSTRHPIIELERGRYILFKPHESGSIRKLLPINGNIPDSYDKAMALYNEEYEMPEVGRGYDDDLRQDNIDAAGTAADLLDIPEGDNNP